tara:strand:- start:2917 stop:3843 length:927 start_codon:yes stop_codon:yes gene_type:complete
MFKVRTMVPADFDEVAELIFLSTNTWYQQHFGRSVFQCFPDDCRIFCEVYEDLDPGCGMVVEHPQTKMIVGSCFYHARETHVSLGIMNVHPNYFGHGIAGIILNKIIEEAETRGLPIRLISSAMNLDSFSLYNRFGFVPSTIFQDMIITVPSKGLPELDGYELPEVREASPSDLLAMGQLEFEISGISRERDYCYFIENSTEIWQTVVSLDENGVVDGFLVSIDHPASRMIGPGVARNARAAEAMLRTQLDRFRGKTVVFLAPASETDYVAAAYALGARNCELHLGQVRGQAQPLSGIVMPSFLPESG